MMILMLFAQGCNSNRNEMKDYNQIDEYDNYYEDDNMEDEGTIDDEYIKEKLTAHTWVNTDSYKGSFEFSEDGTCNYSNSDGVYKPKWSVRDNTLYLTYHSIYSDDTENDQLSYVKLDEDDVSNNILACSNSEFYVSDNYLVFYGRYYYPE